MLPPFLDVREEWVRPTKSPGLRLCGWGWGRRRGWWCGRLAEVRRPENLLTAIGQNDVGALGQAHVRGAGLHPPAYERDPGSDLDRGRCPAELLRQLLPTA